jgi:chromate transport protein ChrA
VQGNFHPIWSFYKKFDYKYKRLVRASILMLQISFISMMTIAAYARGTTLEDDQAPYLVTFFFGVFCLPLPQPILWVIRSALVVFTNGLNQTPEPEVIIEDHCVVLRVLLVSFSVILYLFSMLVMTMFMIGVENDDYSFRVS